MSDNYKFRATFQVQRKKKRFENYKEFVSTTDVGRLCNTDYVISVAAARNYRDDRD